MPEEIQEQLYISEQSPIKESIPPLVHDALLEFDAIDKEVSDLKVKHLKIHTQDKISESHTEVDTRREEAKKQIVNVAHRMGTHHPFVRTLLKDSLIILSKEVDTKRLREIIQEFEEVVSELVKEVNAIEKIRDYLDELMAYEKQINSSVIRGFIIYEAPREDDEEKAIGKCMEHMQRFREIVFKIAGNDYQTEESHR